MKLPTLGQAMLVLGGAYLALLTVPVSIGGRAYLHDALVPLMGILLLAQRERLTEHLRRHWPLSLFLLLSLAVTAAHGLHSPGDLYEWVVFAVLSVLWLFFLCIPLSSRLSGGVGAGLFGICLLAFVYEQTPLPSLFSFTSPQMSSTAMAFLSRRFAFTQCNPNLFALYLAIPGALLARYVQCRDWSSVPLSRRLLAFPALILVMVPVLSSASKHGLLVLGILLGLLPALFPDWRRVWKVLSVSAVLVLAALFETTVLYTVFPVGAHGINRLPGMYSLHQSTYCRMLADHPESWLGGLSESCARRLYPQYTAPDTIGQTLQRYNAMASYTDFLTFMDPHNEYLNLAVLFGVPAMLLMMAFWASRPWSLWAGRRFPAMMFVLALLACCLWDDLLSKRAVWVAAAILFNTSGDSRQ